jgi:hypothetical protein
MIRGLVTLVVVLLVLLVGAGWFQYGTLHPCEMLKTEVARRGAGEESLARVIIDPLVAVAIDGYSAAECARRLGHLWLDGDVAAALEP